MQYKRILECLLASGALILSSHTAFAQVAPPAEGAADSVAKARETEENTVVVTANRVRSNAQTTAVALSVFNGAALADAGVSNVQALQSIDPSINVTSQNGGAYVAIRGVASTDITETGDPAVPIARDGFFTNRSFSIAASMYDLERVEILKGPQGTLFGRNSTGGLINIITAKPREQLGGYLSVDVGNYAAVNLEGAVNVPLSDKVQLRFSALSRRHDGYRHLTGLNLNGDDANAKSARLQLAFQPVAGFEGLLSYQKDKTDETGEVTKVSPIAVVTPIGDARTFPGWAPSYTRLNGERWRWEFSYNRLPWDLTLTYAGGYDTQRYRHATDATNLDSYPATRQFLQGESPDTRNHEIRIATPISGRFTAQAGYFYYTESNRINSGVMNLAMLAGQPDYAQTYGIKFDYLIETKTQGLFSQLGWKLTEDLKFTIGGRYSRDQKQRSGEATLLLGALVSPYIGAPAIVTPGDGAVKESKPTYQLGLDWTLTPQNFLYTKYATGYKAGGFNSNGSAASLPYAAETVKSFELGSKNSFWNRRLKFNAALFYQNYQNYQASQFTNALSSGGGVFNVGKATIKGLETELVATVPDIARFDMGATLLNTRFADGIIVSEASTPARNRDIGGHMLPNAPRFVMTAGVQRSFPVGDAELMARLSAKYSSQFFYSVFNDEDTRSPSYTTANLLLSYKRNGADWELQTYVNNLTDKVVVANAQRNYVSDINTWQFQPPRTYGVRLRYNF